MIPLITGTVTMAERPLTRIQENFAQKFVELGVASLALRDVTDCSRMKASTVTRKAWDLVHHPRVAARIKELRDMSASDLVMSRREALEILSARGRVNFYELIEFADMVMGHDVDGHPIIQSTWRFKDRESMTPEQLAAIAELTAGPQGLKVKTHDPVAAIQLLARMQGWEAPKSVELSGPGGGPVQVEDVGSLTDAELEKLIRDAEPKS
ncbi:terminase small subunit [Stenotrophomonas phage B2]|nr:terminase small subunit [Stenotrophomonas phage B2]